VTKVKKLYVSGVTPCHPFLGGGRNAQVLYFLQSKTSYYDLLSENNAEKSVIVLLLFILLVKLKVGTRNTLIAS
jgi:hypothetical protein